jgi:hypothetical protein
MYERTAIKNSVGWERGRRKFSNEWSDRSAGMAAAYNTFAAAPLVHPDTMAKPEGDKSRGSVSAEEYSDRFSDAV